MEGYHHHQHHQNPPSNPHHISVNVDAGDRFPQWSVQETRDFLMIRSELDQTFMETKRNKLLWEVISNKMKEKGFNRSPDQCKCKWKNLVTRYKGCETMEVDGMRQQFPFYNEFQAIFTARMQRMVWVEAEGSSAKKKGVANLSSDEEDDNEESDVDKSWGTKKRKKTISKNNIIGAGNSGNGSGSMTVLKEILEDFTKQQMQMEMQWLNAYEAREEERKMREKEWKQRMEALENERMMMDRRWREMEEQRRVREEARADKRDLLITQLLNKLRRDQERY
ncbi:trihelix transcription factor GT-3b-like [Impatiens glandulifera]|uniref:trihelix transcription factor GT-3b-like n=1 Tax=Impatiens glandulifera TaxID=253017 RepID=UPI001FB0AD60|nr:trihelix transcription factor GT-3b-like [Impatiens glandulifera]